MNPHPTPKTASAPAVQKSPGFRLPLGLQGLVLLLLLWQVLALVVPPPLVPWPHQVGAELLRLLSQGRLWEDSLASLLRVLAGLTLSLVVGLPLGLVLGRSRRLGALLRPLVYLLFPLPKIAFLPLFLVFFGLGEASKLALLFSVCVFHLALAVAGSARRIPAEYLQAAGLLGLDRLGQYRHVILPALLPALVEALKLVTGISFSVLFFAENFATRRGLGAFVMNAWVMADYPGLYAGISVLGILGFALFSLLDAAARRLPPG